MKKILIVLCGFLLCTTMPLMAEEDDRKEKIAYYLDNYEYEELEEFLKDEANRSYFYDECEEEDWIRYIEMKKMYEDSSSVELMSLIKTYDGLGIDSSAFREGEGVGEHEKKYLYDGSDHLLFEGDVNQRQDNRVISNDNKFKLWVPHWGSYLDEEIGVELIFERLYSDTGWDFKYLCMGKPFAIYLENAKQTAITIRFYANVDTSNNKVNGDRLALNTIFEHIMFGAGGLTHEETTNEYVAAYDPDLPTYIVMDEEFYTSANEYGREVYYASKRNHNVKACFDVKGKDEIKLLVGFTGSGNYKTGGDGTMYFTLFFDSFGLINKSHILTIDPKGGEYEGERIVEGKEDDIVDINTPTMLGYDFDIWEAQYGKVIDNSYTFGDYDDHVEARYKIINYPIKYELNGGENHIDNPDTYTIEDHIVIKEATKPYYRFIKWEEGNDIPVGSSGEKSFTASYEPLSYSIEYLLNDGINDPDNPTSYTIEDEINFKEATKEGYIFKGWKKDDEMFKTLYPYTHHEKTILEAIFEKEDTKYCDLNDKNCDGVISCDEVLSKGWVWNSDKKICEYQNRRKIVNTASK